MPGKVKVKVLAGRHLPVMDRSNDTTDAFVEVKLGGTTCKTDVCRKSLNPQWNSEWFKFEMDDLELQDEPLQIRLMDYDTYSANDAIGKVYIDLNPLLTNPSKTKEPSGRAMSGWIPVYDTMHGIRGEVNLMVKVELFSDLNKFRQSSCGVKFFFTQAIPDGHVAIQLHGFVEELVVNDDPEYQWIDKIRTPRASNEARQLLFLKLAGEVQRRVGLKALELGGNAVIGYRVCFDLEGELGIVVRGIGTAATLAKTVVEPPAAAENPKEFPAGALHPPSPRPLPELGLNPSPQTHSILSLSSHASAAVHEESSASAPVLTHASVSFADQPPQQLPHAHANASPVRLHGSMSQLASASGRPESGAGIGTIPRPPQALPLAPAGNEPDKGGVGPPEVSPTSPTSTSDVGLGAVPQTAPSQFEIQRRRRGSKKRDKYSTSSLLKRVGRVSGGGSFEKKEALSAGEKIRSEFFGFFRRRRRFLSGDTESSTEKESGGKAGKSHALAGASAFRKPRLMFFRREPAAAAFSRSQSQSRRSSSLRRSSSESFSLECVSLESLSLPSAKSELELGIDFDWSHVQIPVIESTAVSFNPLLGLDFEGEVPGLELRSTFDPESLIPSQNGQACSLASAAEPFNGRVGVPSSASILQAVNELGYVPRGEKPLTLYISSLDALLVRAAPSTSSTARAALSECRTVDNLACLGMGIDDMAATATSALSANLVSVAVSVESESDTNHIRRTRDAVAVAVSSSGLVAVAPDGGVTAAATQDSTLPKHTPEGASSSAPPAGDNKAAHIAMPNANAGSGRSASSSSAPASASAPSGEPPQKTTEDETSAVARKRDAEAAGKKGSASAGAIQLSSASSKVSSSSSSSVHTRNGSTGASATASQHVRAVHAAAHFNKASGSVNVAANMLPPQSHAGGRRSSDSELSTPPTGAMNSSIEAIISHSRNISFAKRLAAGTDHFDLLEYPFVTIGQLPPRFVQYIGGAVSARSVKLLERTSNLEEPETRDSWWNEIRLEIRSHARSLCCNVILGYEEQTTICDDVCILSATGTAALVNSSALHEMADKVLALEASTKGDKDKTQAQNEVACNGLKNGPAIVSSNPKARHGSAEDPECSCSCSVCHIPYSEAYLPFPVKMVRCQICKKEKVPDLLLATIGFPSNLPICGKTSLIQAHVFRAKKDSKGESGAKEVSDSVPFLEYELHRRLINKLKMKGMNAIFCLQVQICLGETLMIGVATGTAVCLAALPPPSVPKITGGNLKTDTQKVVQFQRVVQDTYDRNREYYRITSGPFGHYQISAANGHQENNDEDVLEEVSNVDLATGNKDAYVLEVDDAEDIDIISELVDPSPPTACEMNNLDTVVGYEDFRVISQQVFVQIWRCHVPNMTLRHLAGHFDRLLRAVGFKLRAMRPCVINKLRFRVELPEPDEIQISIVGTALGLANKNKALIHEGPAAQAQPASAAALNSKKSIEDSEMIFQLDCVDNNGGPGHETKNHTDEPSKQILVTVRTSITDTSELMSVQDSAGAAAGGLSRTPTDVGSAVGVKPAAVASPTISIPGTEAVAVGGHGHSAGSSATAARTPTQPSFLPAKPAASSPHPQAPISYLPQISRSLLVPSLARTIAKPLLSAKGKYVIEVTTLSCIPGYRVEKYLGNLNCFFIRESTSIKEMGGPSGFVHNFVVEVLAIIRAHVAALGGNALVSYFMTELSILHNPHKNQGQCLINVGGDVVNILPASGGAEEENRLEDT